MPSCRIEDVAQPQVRQAGPAADLPLVAHERKAVVGKQRETLPGQKCRERGLAGAARSDEADGQRWRDEHRARVQDDLRQAQAERKRLVEERVPGVVRRRGRARVADDGPGGRDDLELRQLGVLQPAHRLVQFVLQNRRPRVADVEREVRGFGRHGSETWKLQVRRHRASEDAVARAPGAHVIASTWSPLRPRIPRRWPGWETGRRDGRAVPLRFRRSSSARRTGPPPCAVLRPRD